MGDILDRFGTVAILAGGKSSRMGFDKELICINGQSLMKKNIRMLKKVFDEIIVVTNNPKFYEGEDVKTIQDIIFQKGPLSGLHAALTAAKSEYVYLMACDMPEIDLDLIEHMKKKLAEEDVEICIPRVEGKLEPFNGFYSKKLTPKIESCLLNDVLAIRNIVYSSKACVVDFEGSYKKDTFLNLNTRDELDEYSLRENRDRESEHKALD